MTEPSNLRDAKVVWDEALRAYAMSDNSISDAPGYTAAIAIIEADRAAVEAAKIAKVVAWLRDVLDPLDEDHDGWLATGVADAIEAGKWKQ